MCLGADAICVSDQCQHQCPAGQVDYDTFCVDPQKDVNKCGAGGKVCTAGASAAGTCVQGTRAFSCTGGSLDCDGNAASECEVNAATDVNNCDA
jgi:hypothetical protein